MAQRPGGTTDTQGTSPAAPSAVVRSAHPRADGTSSSPRRREGGVFAVTRMRRQAPASRDPAPPSPLMRPCRPVPPHPAPRSCCRSAGSAGRPRHLILSPVGTQPSLAGAPRSTRRCRSTVPAPQPAHGRSRAPPVPARQFAHGRSHAPPSPYVRTPVPLMHPPVPTRQPIRARQPVLVGECSSSSCVCSSWGCAAACTRPAHTLGRRTCPVVPARPAVRAHLDIAAGNPPHTGCGRPHVPCNESAAP